MLNALATQRSGLHAATAGGTGSIPVQGTRILHATQHGQKKKKEACASLYTPTPICASPWCCSDFSSGPWDVMGDVAEGAVLTLNSLFAAATCLLVTFVIFKLWFFKHLVVKHLTC